MFTGLIETLGQVTDVKPRGEQTRISIALPFVHELALGDSVAVNGCCLTVSALSISEASFDLLKQTLKVTSLGQLKGGELVNLERALRVGDRLGGHFVQGHVDTTGEVLTWEPHGQDHKLEVTLPSEIHKLCLPKGSITIDGISLTIAELSDHSATCWITPHTAEVTHLTELKIGQRVNLEGDLLAKHVQQQLEQREIVSPNNN